ncbi:hypothetical protein MBCUT_00130 [Methanobrevibacter cuticularis]|uniref:Uncharacterized protein n=1 Tax=Methanobrevibacter cuticularis TaxID=47311 RepID=A0A166FLZ1_9EURY|nr:hypothetical protein [Methanobrevibacter cuticularis]KZX17816.1 hypothetical protein MBCUT_00130 [Methanobrevibacter cuticularis]
MVMPQQKKTILNHINKNYKEFITKEEKKIDKIKLVLNSKTVKTSRKRFKKLENIVNELPNPIAVFIKKLSKTFERSINYIKNKFLPNTNNLLECYIGVTLPRYLKKDTKHYTALKKD